MALLDHSDGAAEKVGGVDGAELGDEALVLAPGTDDEPRSRGAAQRARRAEPRLEFRQCRAAVAHVAPRPLDHHRNASAFHHRIVDALDCRAHGQAALGVAGDAREVAGRVDDAPREGLDRLDPQTGGAIRIPPQQLGCDGVRNAAGGDQYLRVRSLCQALGDGVRDDAIGGEAKEGHSGRKFSQIIIAQWIPEAAGRQDPPSWAGWNAICHRVVLPSTWFA